jgi:iron complex outermembrane receptor protein
MKAVFLIASVLFTSALFAGIKDTVALEEVIKLEKVSRDDINTPLTEIKYQQGKKLSDVLGEFSSVYVKNYGNGQLASLAVRGTSAAQTEVQWNGIKLNSPVLGQVDLSLFAVGLQDELSLARTGYKGTIGGTLLLQNQWKKEEGLSADVAFRAGSFKTYEALGSLNYRKGKVGGSTRVSYLSCANNFCFKNTFREGHPLQQQQNAQVRLLSFLQQLQVNVNANNTLGFYLWLNEAQRQIPPIMSKVNGREKQYDYSLRTMAEWKGNFKQLRVAFTSAYLADKLRYMNPDALLDETTLTTAVRNNFKAAYTFTVPVVVSAEMNYDYEQAEVKSYYQLRTRHIAGARLYADYYHTSGLKVHAGFREDVVDAQFSPFAPEVALSYLKKIKEKHSISAGVIASRNFRFPTLNDLYWVPGGNPHLKQEKSWNADVNVRYAFSKFFDVSVSNFYIYVDNWIQWVPNGSNWSATNFKRVFSRGVEAAVHVASSETNSPDKFIVHLNASYTFTKTTNLDAASAFDQSKGRQLIYVPLHSLTAALQLQYKRFYWRAVSNVVSRLYTSTDNTQWLKGFSLFDLETGKDFVMAGNEIGLSFRVNNVANAAYQSVAQRPMPGRSFEGTIRFKLQTPNP